LNAPAALPRQARSAETRRKILQAAITTFGRNGLSGAKMRAIAEEAGVTHTLLTYHFASKERLWRECADAIYRRYAQRLEERIQANSGLDGKTRLKTLLRAIVGSAAENPEIHRFMVRYALEEADEPTAEAAPVPAALTREIQSLQAEGVLPKDADPLILQSILSGAATQIFLGASRFEQRSGRDSHDPEVLKAYLDALIGCLVRE